MKKWIYISAICALLLCLVQPVAASTLTEDLEKALPPEAEALLKDIGDRPVDLHTLPEGLARLWDGACAAFGDVLRGSLRGVVLLLGVVLLCAVVSDCVETSDDGVIPNFTPMAGAMAITLIAAGNLHTMMGVGVETIEELDIFSKALLPTLSAAVAASGGVVTAGFRQVASIFCAELLISLIRGVLLPLVYLYIAAAAANAMLPGQRLKSIGKAISKGVTWLLTGLLVLYTGFLTVSGALTGSADTLTVQLTRSAMGTVPVVGSIISDAAGSVLAGAAAVKNTVGVVGMLGVLALCLMPFLRLAVQYLLYKLAAFLAGTVGSPDLMELIEALGGAFGMILGMTAACALLLLISIATTITVVTI